MKEHKKLLISLVLGIVLGTFFHEHQDIAVINWFQANVLYLIGQGFLRLIFMIVVPMVFSAMVLGIYELISTDNFGRVAKRTLFFTLLASSLAVTIGILIVNILKPGVGAGLRELISSGSLDQVASIQNATSGTKSIRDTLLGMIPSNPVLAASNALSGEMLSFMMFTVIFGIAYAFVFRVRTTEPIFIHLMEEIYAATMKIVEYVLRLTPYAIFSIIFQTSYKLGYEFLFSVFFYVFCVVLGLCIQQFVVYSLLLKIFTKRSPIEFFKSCREVYLYAFSTASSNASLPLALIVAEQRLGLSPKISRFVLTIGATANQNGTALFEGVTVLFLAQVFGVDLSLGSQVYVIIICILAGVGTAGVPGGSLPVVMLLLSTIGVPAEGMALILGVDRFLDMCRTTLNVSGDLVIAALVDEKSDSSVHV